MENHGATFLFGGRDDSNTKPYHPCMVYLPTFTRKINVFLAVQDWNAIKISFYVRRLIKIQPPFYLHLVDFSDKCRQVYRSSHRSYGSQMWFKKPPQTSFREINSMFKRLVDGPFES